MLDNKNCLELRRFAISPDAPKNTASRMLGFMVRSIRKIIPEISTLLSYQDKEVHTGTIYAASGWHRAARVQGKREWSILSRQRVETQTDAHKIRWEKIV
jgi:hypothetical protein